MSADKEMKEAASAKPVEGQRTKVKNKAATDKPASFSPDQFNRLRIPDHIQKELDAAGLKPRFVSIKVLSESGGFHPKGWVPYVVKNPIENPLTGQAEKTYKVGDLVLAVKTKEDHAQHTAYLKQRAQAQVAAQGESVKQMRDKIREGRAEKHISLLEGYENDDEDE